MTNRAVVSRVRATHKIFADASLNDRAILAELKGVALSLINQKTNTRRLWNTDTIFTPLDCLEMTTVPLGECCQYQGNRMVSRSKHKIPAIAEGNYQYLIQGVYDVAVSRDIKYAPINRYLNILKLKLEHEDVYYWIHNGYLYVSSPNVQRAKLVAHFTGDVPYDLLYPECDCIADTNNGPCMSRMDEEFKCPGNLIDAAVKETSRSLLTSYFRIPEDHTSDDKNDQTNTK
jgi:hypothetical protein